MIIKDVSSLKVLQEQSIISFFGWNDRKYNSSMETTFKFN